MDRLLNASRDYDWGSTLSIPRFLGDRPDGRPFAEVWMGTHALSPSVVEVGDAQMSLAERSGELPFMMKILAADRPLSLQVHPSEAMAKAGFEAEEAAGVRLDAPERTYKDPRPKPEMTYALTTFDTLVGFRPTAEILRIFAALDTPLTNRLGEELRCTPGFDGIVRIVELLLSEPVEVRQIRDVVTSCHELLDQHVDIKRAFVTVIEIAEHFRDDVGLVISLMLNRLTLQPGEAAFLGAGIIHAHLKGMCLEVMTCSDNVLRAGLTSKHVDPEGLVACLEGGMSRLARITPILNGTATEVFVPDVHDFALAVTQVSRADPDGTELYPASQRILVCISGEVVVHNAHGQQVTLVRGESVYAGPEDGALRAFGTGEVAQAFAPTSDLGGRLIDLV